MIIAITHDKYYAERLLSSLQKKFPDVKVSLKKTDIYQIDFKYDIDLGLQLTFAKIFCEGFDRGYGVGLTSI